MEFEKIRVIRNLDIFGVPPRLSIYGKEKFKTSTGGMFSIAFFSVSIFLFLSLGSDMFYHKNPNATSAQIFEKSPSRSAIGPNDYFFIFGMQRVDNYQHYYDPSIYTITFLQNEQTIPFERCTPDHLPTQPELNKFFMEGHHSNISELICIAKENATSFQLSGDFVGGNYKFIEIRVSPCVNSTTEGAVVCKPWEEIEKRLYNGYFAFYSTDSIIDITNFDSPSKRVGLDYFIETGLTIQRSVNRLLRTNKVRSDNGWMINEKQEMEYTSHYIDRETVALIKSERLKNDFFLRFLIRKSVYEMLYERSFLKIQQVMAYMGGFLHIAYYILFLISSPLIEKQFNDEITNSLFDFEDRLNEDTANKSDDCKPDSLPKGAVKKMVITKDKSSSNTQEKPGGKIGVQRGQKGSRSHANLFKSQERPLLLSVFDIIKGKIFKINSVKIKYLQRKKAIQAISQKLDLSYILNKLSEIEKIKMILMDEDQFSIFDYLPKPVIQLDQKINYSYRKETQKKYRSQKSFLHLQHEAFNIKALEAQKAFQNILNKQELSVMDWKLITLLNDDLKKAMNNGQLPSLISNLNERQKHQFHTLASKLDFNKALEEIKNVKEDLDASVDATDLAVKIQMYK